jgi:hypothetical protein
MFNIFLIMFDEKSFKYPNFDNFFLFQICSNEANKNLILKIIKQYYVKCNL